MVVVFGEVLWDVFGDERKIGGAPFNFAAHLAQLGQETAFVSAVGDDELGQAARQAAAAYGMQTTYLNTAAQPTGVCQVTLRPDGTPQYALVEDVAYDHIVLTAAQTAALRERPLPLLYFGTLAQRGEESRKTLRRLAETGSFAEVFCDINIRPPFFSAEVLRDSLRLSTILKISREEYAVLEQLGLVAVAGGEEPYAHRLCRALAEQYPRLRQILVTLDKDGALLYDKAADTVLYSERPRSKLVSAVGAGDSFSAAFVYNRLRGASPADCLNRATILSDYVVTQLGAVPSYPPALRAQVRGES